MFVEDPILAQDGGLAIATFAELKGLELAFRTYGSGSGAAGTGTGKSTGSSSSQITWKEVVEPAAKLAENWQINKVTELYIKKIETQLFSGKYPEIASLYLKNSPHHHHQPHQQHRGRTYTSSKEEPEPEPERERERESVIKVLKEEGDWVQQPQLAATLRTIAAQGSDYLYNDMAGIIASEIQAAGGIITENDIKTYMPTIRTPLETTVMGYDYIGSPPPSSGGATVAAILGYLSGYDQPMVSQKGLYFHRLAEAFKVRPPPPIFPLYFIFIFISYDFLIIL